MCFVPFEAHWIVSVTAFRFRGHWGVSGCKDEVLRLTASDGFRRRWRHEGLDVAAAAILPSYLVLIPSQAWNQSLSTSQIAGLTQETKPGLTERLYPEMLPNCDKNN